jgi:hypothetical protein
VVDLLSSVCRRDWGHKKEKENCSDDANTHFKYYFPEWWLHSFRRGNLVGTGFHLKRWFFHEYISHRTEDFVRAAPALEGNTKTRQKDGTNFMGHRIVPYQVDRAQ